MSKDILDIRQKGYIALYPRASQRICSTYSYFSRYLSDCVYDRFGIIDDVPSPFSIPKRNDKDVLDVSFRRALDIGEADIAWSGGVDSSFLIAVYLMVGIRFRVFYNDIALSSAPLLYEHLKSHGVNMVYMKDLSDFKQSEKLITGDVVDTLFFPSSAGMQNHCIGRNIFDSFFIRYGILEAERLIAIVEDYGRRFDKPVKTDDDIVRLMSWSCLYYAHREAFYQMLGGFDNLVVFFDTQEFTDISWTQYWESRLSNNDKIVFRQFLRKVFGDIADELRVQRSFYYRISRKIKK